MTSIPLLNDLTGDGESIVLVPGGLSGWRSWIPHAKRLASDRKVIRVQLRSIELAEAGELHQATYGSHTERDALLATVDTLGLDRFDLVGWSYGGHVSLAFALENPDRVRTLTVIEPPATWVLRETGHVSAASARDEAFDRSFMRRDITIDDLKAFLVRAGFGQPGDDFEASPSWPTWERNRQALSINGTIQEYNDSLDRLWALDIPILVVRGTDTTETLSMIAGCIAATAPNATLLELPGGHACHIQHIDRFLEELERHLAGAVAR